MTNFVTPRPILTIRKNKQKIYCLKIIEPVNTWQISSSPTPFRVDVINVWYLISPTLKNCNNKWTKTVENIKYEPILEN